MEPLFTGEILAFDLATKSGWCRGCPGETPRFGTMLLHGDKPGRYRAFREWVQLMLPGAARVAFEASALPMLVQGRTNFDTVRFLIGLAEHLEEMCEGVVPCCEHRTSDVRCFFIGRNMKREAAKAATVERCELLGLMPANHDEADAIAVWAFEIARLRPDLAHEFSPLFRVRRRVMMPPTA